MELLKKIVQSTFFNTNIVQQSNLIALIFILGCTTSTALKTEQVEWNFPMISRGQNFPSLRLNNYRNVLLKIRNGQNVEKNNTQLSELLNEGLIKKVSANNYKLNFFSASPEDGKILYEKSRKPAKDIVSLIEKRIDQIKKKTSEHEALSKYSFEEVSFYVLSDVLLDDVQIDVVEKRFLKKERPLRGKSRYYLGMMARNKSSDTESFGIYGNQCVDHGKVANCLYGNRRYSFTGSRNFATIKASELKATFPEIEKTENKKVKGQLLLSYLKARKNKDANKLKRFQTVGLPKNIVIFSMNEYKELGKIAQIIEDDLIQYFNKHKESLIQDWTNSRYVNESSFEEYFIWWYHFLYTEITNQLAQKGHLKVPKSGNFPYLVLM